MLQDVALLYLHKDTNILPVWHIHVHQQQLYLSSYLFKLCVLLNGKW